MSSSSWTPLVAWPHTSSSICWTSSRSSCCLSRWGRTRWGWDCCRLGPNPIWSSALTPTAFRMVCRQPWGGLNSWRATPTRWTLSWWLGTRFWNRACREVPDQVCPGFWFGSRMEWIPARCRNQWRGCGKRAWPSWWSPLVTGTIRCWERLWVHPSRSICSLWTLRISTSSVKTWGTQLLVCVFLSNFSKLHYFMAKKQLHFVIMYPQDIINLYGLFFHWTQKQMFRRSWWSFPYYKSKYWPRTKLKKKQQ